MYDWPISWACRLGRLILSKSSKVVADMLLSSERICFRENPFGVFVTVFGVGFIGEGVKLEVGLGFLTSSVLIGTCGLTSS